MPTVAARTRKSRGKLSLARKLFVTWRSHRALAVVQSDCARFADDLSRQQPYADVRGA